MLLFLLLVPLTAHAHKIRVFAYGEGDVIKGETSFNGGKAARNISIIVTDQNTSEALLTTKTDEKGEFSFPVSDAMKNNQADLLIVASAGEGHRNEWLLAAADYLPDIEKNFHRAHRLQKKKSKNRFQQPPSSLESMNRLSTELFRKPSLSSLAH